MSAGRKNQTKKNNALHKTVKTIETIPSRMNIIRTNTPKIRIMELKMNVSSKLLTLYSSFILIHGENSVETSVGIENILYTNTIKFLALSFISKIALP